jgi:hypothetical protein
MARGPGLREDAIPKSLLEVLDYHSLSRAVEKLI